MKHIILCRHGETEWSRDHKHTSFTDLSLTDLGQAQAKNLEAPLKSYAFDEVYTSPLKRAVAKRGDALIKKWVERDKNILLFAHGYFLRVLGARWIGLPPKDARLLALSVASISILGFEREQRVLQAWSIPNRA